MTMFENVAFGLRVRPRGRRPAEDQIRKRANELLGLVQLKWSGWHVNAAGPRVKIDLTSKWGDPVRVEIDHAEYRALALKESALVYLSPREHKVFTYQI